MVTIIIDFEDCTVLIKTSHIKANIDKGLPLIINEIKYLTKTQNIQSNPIINQFIYFLQKFKIGEVTMNDIQEFLLQFNICCKVVDLSNQIGVQKNYCNNIFEINNIAILINNQFLTVNQ